MLRFMGSQRVRHDRATELNQSDLIKGGYSSLRDIAGSMMFYFLDKRNKTSVPYFLSILVSMNKLYFCRQK